VRGGVGTRGGSGLFWIEGKRLGFVVFFCFFLLLEGELCCLSSKMSVCFVGGVGLGSGLRAPRVSSRRNRMMLTRASLSVEVETATVLPIKKIAGEVDCNRTIDFNGSTGRG